MKNKLITLLAAAVLWTATNPAGATPYASGVSNNAGNVSFFVNESADSIKVILSNGAGGTNTLSGTNRGQYSFSLGTNTSYKIVVTKASGAGYKSSDGSGGAVKLQISDSTNPNLNFENPRAIAVNQNPSSKYFGRIYAANTRTNRAGLPRVMGIGIYMINPDQTSAHGAGLENTPMRPSNWPLAATSSSSGNTFPYGFCIGSDDSVYVADWTDSTGNLWITSGDASDPGSSVLKLLSGVGTALTPIGNDNTHGSINAAWIEGSVAQSNLVAYTIDEDMQTDKTTTIKTELASLWRYDILGNALPYTADATKVYTASGISGIATNASTCDMVRGKTNGYFYITTQTTSLGIAGLSVVDASGTVLWDSRTASQTLVPGGNIITNALRVALSRDEKYIAVARSTGYVWIMPLINGLPNLTNRLALQAYGATGNAIRGIAFDAANNLYVDGNSTEVLAIFSPGGTTVATTANDTTGTNGTFDISVPAAAVTATASVASVTENGGTNGVFTITRTGDNSTSITVGYTISGTASNTVDFTTGPGSVILAPFQTTTNIQVVPIGDSTPELTETVVLTLQGGAGYSVGSPGSATVSIVDDDAPVVSFEPSSTQKLLESYAPSKVTFQLTRRGSTITNLTVNLAYSGTATYGVDYSGSASVTLGSGVASTNLVLSPINDQLYEGDESIIVTVAPGTGYVPANAPSNSVSATIIDDEYPAGSVLFSDNFETDSSTNWIVNLADPSDAFVDFAWDYSLLAGIPQAPGGTGTKGLKMRCGNTFLEIDGLSVSPTNQSFPSDYRLRFDMWINYNGPMPDGGAGSTQHFDAGVGTDGSQVIYYNNPSSDSVWFTASGDGADGATFGDYTAYIGAVKQGDDTGFYSAGTGGVNSGRRDNGDPFYAYWGGQAAPAAQLLLYPGQTGVANIGNAGMAWHTVVITKVGDVVSWAMDGIVIANVTNTLITLNSNIFVGYQDRFATGNVSDEPAMSFGLVDNLRVETYVSAPLAITGIGFNGGNVEITFTGSTSANPGDFKLQSSLTPGSGYGDDNTASIVSNGPAGSFKASTARTGGAKFFRIKF